MTPLSFSTRSVCSSVAISSPFRTSPTSHLEDLHLTSHDHDPQIPHHNASPFPHHRTPPLKPHQRANYLRFRLHRLLANPRRRPRIRNLRNQQHDTQRLHHQPRARRLPQRERARRRDLPRRAEHQREDQPASLSAAAALLQRRRRGLDRPRDAADPGGEREGAAGGAAG